MGAFEERVNLASEAFNFQRFVDQEKQKYGLEQKWPIIAITPEDIGLMEVPLEVLNYDQGRMEVETGNELLDTISNLYKRQIDDFKATYHGKIDRHLSSKHGDFYNDLTDAQKVETQEKVLDSMLLIKKEVAGGVAPSVRVQNDQKLGCFTVVPREVTKEVLAHEVGHCLSARGYDTPLKQFMEETNAEAKGILKELDDKFSGNRNSPLFQKALQYKLDERNRAYLHGALQGSHISPGIVIQQYGMDFALRTDDANTKPVYEELHAATRKVVNLIKTYTASTRSWDATAPLLDIYRRANITDAYHPDKIELKPVERLLVGNWLKSMCNMAPHYVLGHARTSAANAAIIAQLGNDPHQAWNQAAVCPTASSVSRASLPVAAPPDNPKEGERIGHDWTKHTHKPLRPSAPGQGTF